MPSSKCDSAIPLGIANHLQRLARDLGSDYRLSSKVPRGLSAATTYQVLIGEFAFALRDWNWPDHRLPRLRSILAFQRLLGQAWPHDQMDNWKLSGVGQPAVLSVDQSKPVAFVVDNWAVGDSIACEADRLWTLATWRPGRAWTDATVDYPVAEVARVLAVCHYISAQHHCSLACSKNWDVRWQALQRTQAVVSQLAIGALPESKALHSSAQALASALADGTHDSLLTFAKSQQTVSLTQCNILSDVHHGNWLFEGEQVSGIVDFGAVRFDWPGWDLVRFTTSFAKQNDALEQAFLSDYVEYLTSLCRMDGTSNARWLVKYLGEVEQSLGFAVTLRCFDRLQTLLSIQQWCQWIGNGTLGLEAGEQRLAELNQRWSDLAKLS